MFKYVAAVLFALAFLFALFLYSFFTVGAFALVCLGLVFLALEGSGLDPRR